MYKSIRIGYLYLQEKEKMMANELAVMETSAAPAELMTRAQAAAESCRAIIGHCVQHIQGRDYLRVEGWQALAAVSGCTVSISKVEQLDEGIAATAEVRRQSDGTILAKAEGFVGNDEKMWAARPLYARRAMAQTRATSRACRVAFAHLVVLLDPKLSTTPAEEIDPHEVSIVALATGSDMKALGELMEETGTTSDDMVRRFGPGKGMTKAKWHDAMEYLRRIQKDLKEVK
jgi:hypothetical protein